MRTFLLLLSFVLFTFSGWSQDLRIMPVNSGETSFSQDFLVNDHSISNAGHLTKKGYVNGTQELPVSNSAITSIIERDRSDYIRCSTVEMEAARRAADPSIPSNEEFEQWMMQKIAQMDAEGHDRRATYEIPYIVHVVHAGENIGTGPNLAASKINAQMAQLTADYQRMNSDVGNTPGVFSGVVGSMDILFKPAVVDPVGNTLAEPGIERINGSSEFGITSWDGIGAGSNTQLTLKPNTFWDPTRYMNIWTCNLGDDLLGYAQFPEAGSLPGIGTGNGSSNTDGVVVLYATVGSLSNPGTAAPYHYGRTMTHEVGHWLGLRHIWGDGPVSGSCGVDDHCDDTPNAGDANLTGSPCTFPGTNSCDDGGGDLADMFQNYMDYSDDGCMNLFTADQIGRVTVVLADDGSGSANRASLLSSNVGEGGGPSACTAWTANDGTGVWIDFNDEFGGAPCDPGTGCQFNELDVFEVWASEAYSIDNFVEGATYSFSMCNGSGAGSWVPEFTIVAPSGAIDAFGAGDGDACTITWTASESGAYTIIINEAGFCGPGSTNEATNNGYPALTCTSGPEPECFEVVTGCHAGELVEDDSIAVCPGEDATVEIDGTDTIPTGGQYRWNFAPGVDGTGANGVGFSIGGQGTSFTFDAGVNGALASAPDPGPYPDMAGTWIVSGFILDSDDMVCSSTPTSRSITFLPEETPGCDPVEPCSAGTLANSDSMAYCPGESANIATNGDEMIPAAGGFAWQFTAGPDGTGGPGSDFYLTGPTDYTFDASLNGGLGANPDLAGTWYVIGFSFADSLDVASSFCEFTSTFKPVNFLAAEDPACAETCEVPTSLNVENIGMNSADVSWAAGNVESGDWDLELVDITAGGNFTGTPTSSTITTSENLSGLASGNDYDVYVRENCADVIDSDIIITGVMDGPLTGGQPTVVEIYTLNPIADLSIYGLGSANNGDGTDGIELNFPPIAFPSGIFIRFTTDSIKFVEFFGFSANVVDDFALIDGDDAIELFKNGEVVDVFGEITHSGAGAWNYQDGWAYRNLGTGPDGNTFNIDNWTFSGPNALDGETSNATATTPFPIGSYSTARIASDWVGPERFTTLVDPCDPDNDNPTATCQDLTVQLDEGGDASLVAADINDGSSDACGDVTLSADITDFDCGDLPSVSVTLTVTDENSNESTCASTVTVEDPLGACVDPCDPDNDNPTATCQDLTVQLDEGGDASLVAADINDGSSDACGEVTLSADITDFDCGDLPSVSVTLTVTDGNSNESTCASTVTVEDPLEACADPCVGTTGDDQFDPIEVPSFPYTDVQNTADPGCFTDQNEEQLGDDVFYRMTTGPNTDSLIISTCNDTTDFDTWVYLVSNVGVILQSNDYDFNCGFNVRLGDNEGASTVRADVDPSTEYFVVVDGDAGASGTFELNITEIELEGVMAPENDTCGAAILIACSDSIAGSTTDANPDGSLGFCGTTLTSAPGVWYKFIGTGDEVTFSLCGSSFDTKIGVFSGSCTSLACEDGNDDECDAQSEVAITTTLATEYFIYVTGYDDEAGDFGLKVTCVTPPDAPANDSCASAIDIACDDVINASTDGASIDLGIGNCGTDLDESPGVWYHFTGTGENVTFSLCGTGFDTKMGVFTGSCESLVCDSGNDDFCSLQSEVTLTSVPATDYYVYVTGYNGVSGDFTLAVTCSPAVPAPANDTCSGAFAFSCPDGISTMTVDATAATAADAPFCDATSSSVGAGLWYTYEGDGQLLDILAEPYGFDAEIQIWSGSCEDLSCVLTEDGGVSSGDAELIDGFVTEVGVTYYIYVGSWISTITEIDSFDLTITCSDPPTCPAPTEITISNIDETTADVSWTPGGDETLWHIEIVDLTAGDPVTGVPTFSGITDTFFTLIGGVPGNDYAVYVISDCGADSSEWVGPEEFTTLFPAPDNDLCAGAIEIGCESETDGTTLGATNTDEPGYCGTSLSSGPGVWYSFTGTGGDVTFSTCNAADFDTKIGVFSGACGDLTCVDGNDDGSGCSGFSSELTVPTDAGETYYIYITGFLSTAGDFTLSVACAEIPVCEAPTGLMLDEVTDVTADISWTAGDDETLWDLEFVDVTGGGSFTGIPTETGLTTTSYNATGLTPGSSYEVWVRADCGEDTSAWVGPLEFTTIVPAPENDLCEGAVEVGCGAVVSGTTIDATTTDAPDSYCGTAISAPGVWYYFAGNGDAVTFSTCGTADYDTKLSVFEGDCSELSCVDGNDDGSGCPGFTSELTIVTDPGTSYYIYVHGFSTSTGNFDLSVTCVTPPDNDLCENAEEVTCGSVTTGTTEGATDTDEPGYCGASVSSPGVWYYFAGTDQDATFSTCGTADFDTKISVYSGSCGDLTCVDGNDDGSGCPGYTSELEVRTYVGTDYYIYIHGFSSETGNFDLSVTCADTCEAVTIEVGDITDVGCSGSGGIDITVTTGEGPFDYLWSDESTDEDLIATVGGDYSVTVTGADGCVATAGPFEILEEPAPGETAPPVVTSPGCSFSGEGSIDVAIGGGTPPYSFLWSSGDTTEDLSGLAAGTYTLTVTDDVGCIYTTQDFVLTETNELIELAPAVVTPVDCYGNTTGAIDITVGGGTPPYTYRWSNDIHTEDVDGLAAGEYVIYVEDATGCTYTSAIILVGESDLLVVSGGTTADADCNGASTGSVTGISVTGGTEPYSYLWSDGTATLDHSALTAGAHQLTVTDANGCETLSTIYVIQEPATISITSVVVTDALCNGEATGAIDIEVTGGTPPYTYLWDNSEATEDISGLIAGDYSVTITDAADCTFESTVTVGEPEAMDLSAVSVTDASCNGGDDGAIDITVTGGTPPYTYSWDNGDDTQDIDGLTAGDYSGTITDANGCTFSGTITVGEPDELTITTALVTDISCNGNSDGSIDIEVAGGTPPYTYSWSNEATTQDLEDLGLGVYVVNITDANGCILVSPGLIINQPAPLTLAGVDITDNLCNGDEAGEIDITVVGGTEPYTYSWDNSSTDEDLSGLAAGFYTVTITDGKGCTIESPEIEVEEPFVVFEALPAVVTDVSCFGDEDGAIDITLEGGTLAYDIVWSNGANIEDPTGLAPGDYSFTVTDFNGCVFDFGPITVGEPEALTLLDAGLTNVACFGESTGGIDVTIGGGTEPYSYLWSDGSIEENLTGVPAGFYSGTVTDANGCSLSSPPIPIIEPATALEATGESTPASDPGTSDGTVTVTVTGGDGPYDFLWNTGDITQNLDGVGVGTFCAEITDANDCTIELCVEVGLSTAVLDIFQISDLVLYPNPSNDIANLKMSFTTPGDVSIQLTDAIGRVLESTESLNVIEDELTFDVREFAAGTYFIRLRVEGEVITLPFVVQH
ncbi:MAG: T9SS type A sorting domain-containing protein [Bacteroidetes bacterium]|nr:T9SS type A sorting domain-containing protein [Bacteroidota bacterium]